VLKPWGGGSVKRGLPIGNLTSQLFANVYLDELDKFVKQVLKFKYYIRYTDDFIFVHRKKEHLVEIIAKLENFLHDRLQMSLHPNKIILRKVTQGTDFLGYVVLPYHKAIRTRTKRRMIRKLTKRRCEYELETISRLSFRQTVQSYLGMTSHANSRDLKLDLKRFI